MISGQSLASTPIASNGGAGIASNAVSGSVSAIAPSPTFLSEYLPYDLVKPILFLPFTPHFAFDMVSQDIVDHSGLPTVVQTRGDGKNSIYNGLSFGGNLLPTLNGDFTVQCDINIRVPLGGRSPYGDPIITITYEENLNQYIDVLSSYDRDKRIVLYANVSDSGDGYVELRLVGEANMTANPYYLDDPAHSYRFTGLTQSGKVPVDTLLTVAITRRSGISLDKYSLYAGNSSDYLYYVGEFYWDKTDAVAAFISLGGDTEFSQFVVLPIARYDARYLRKFEDPDDPLFVQQRVFDPLYLDYILERNLAILQPAHSPYLISSGTVFIVADATITATSPTLRATAHDSTGEQAAYLTAPSPTLTIRTGANSTNTAPRPTLSATCTAVMLAKATLSTPKPTLSSSGTVSRMATVDLTAPRPNLVGYGGAMCVATLTSKPTLVATGTTGSVASVEAACPLFVMTVSASKGNMATANLIAPSPEMGRTIRAKLIAPRMRSCLTAYGDQTV